MAEQAGWNLTWLTIPEDMFSRDLAQMKSSFTLSMKYTCIKKLIFVISFYPLANILLLKYPNASKIIWGTGSVT